MSTTTAVRRRFTGSLAIVAALTLGLTGCQVGTEAGTTDATVREEIALPPMSELTPLADPTSYVGPTNVVVSGPVVEPISNTPEPELPVTVVSKDRGGDKEVTVTDDSRIIALSQTGEIAEIVHTFGLGDNLVGRDVSTDFPGSEDLPLVTKGGHEIDAETIMSLNPTVILTDGSIGPLDVLLQLRDLGIPVVMVDRAVDPETSFNASKQIAAALGIPSVADEVNEKLAAEIAAKEAEVEQLVPADESKRPRVAFLYVRGTAGIYYLFGEGSGADSLINSVDALDVAQEVGLTGEKPMTDEALVALDPDVILVMTKGLESANGVEGLIKAQPSIAQTTAGKNNRIVDIDDTQMFSYTQRANVIDGLARALYAPDSLAGFGGNK
ncbi:ABC transporter substrate-binding protein [Leucobacter sp. cx-328]|uniref:heme/hemin ABC transporter substrate-binding protein n=1 Tax=unclassified Leucobacter TaxID=2621730 RepID=UPI00165E43DD|nr:MULTISPECIES: ABC transporter substrate-binding protein [unclassified Leucobacter]MBC9943744.1 ABC transporter substrate-binding protein [Leucobacter sp. cx-328]